MEVKFSTDLCLMRLVGLPVFRLLAIICFLIFGPEAFANDLKPVYDARQNPKPSKLSLSEETVMKTKVSPAAKKVWTGKDCKAQLRSIDVAAGSFTKAGSRQKAVLYEYCMYGHNFALSGLAVLEDDQVVAHIVYDGGGDNAIGALPDIDGSGLSAILISSGGTNQGETWGSVSLIGLANNSVIKFGRTSVFSDTCGVDEKTGKSAAVKLLVKPGPKPVFYGETFHRKDCEDAGWTKSGGRKLITLEKDDIDYRYIK